MPTPSNSPPELADYGIDCSCPFNLPAQTIDDTYQYNIPDFSTGLTDPICPLFFLSIGETASFFVNGDFDVKINVNNAANQHVACFKFLLTISKA